MHRWEVSVIIYLFLLPIFPPSSHSIVLQHPTRPVDNVVIATKGLQERKTQLLNGTTVDKKEIKIN